MLAALPLFFLFQVQHLVTQPLDHRIQCLTVVQRDFVLPYPFCQTTFYPYRSVCSSEYSAQLQKQCLRLTLAPAEQFNFTLLFETIRLILHWRLHFCDSQCCILPCSSVVNPFTTAFTVVFTEQSKWSYKRCSLMSLSPAICAMTSLAALLTASSIISLETSSSFLF